jgi:hypothetical protein
MIVGVNRNVQLMYLRDKERNFQREWGISGRDSIEKIRKELNLRYNQNLPLWYFRST